MFVLPEFCKKVTFAVAYAVDGLIDVPARDGFSWLRDQPDRSQDGNHHVRPVEEVEHR
jgi:hypothetical protein